MSRMWKPIPGFEGLYIVSDFGQVRGLKRGHCLRPNRKRTGYLQVTLSRGGVNHYRDVHRLVAQAFLPNPEGKPQVNHKNGQKSDNRACNLEWVTESENQRHRFEVLGHRGHTARPVVCLETGSVYPSAKAAAEDIGCNRSSVSQCCLGTRKSCKNLHFKFKEEIIHD